MYNIGMSTNDLEVSKKSAEVAENQADDKNSVHVSSEKDVSFRSEDIKERDYSELFTKVEGEDERKRAAERERKSHDKNVNRRRKKFQQDLKKKEREIIRTNRINALRAWLKHHKKKLVIGVGAIAVAVISIGAGFLINRIINPPLTEEQQAVADYDIMAENTLNGLYENVFSKYDPESEDPSHLSEIYAQADEYINGINDAEKPTAYANYATFASSRGDYEKMKTVLDTMGALDLSDIDKYKYYNCLANYWSLMGDNDKFLEYVNKAKEYTPAEYLQ